jgi:hypothetical protein
MSFVLHIVIAGLGYLVDHGGSTMSEKVLNGRVKVCNCIFRLNSKCVYVFKGRLFYCEVMHAK